MKQSIKSTGRIDLAQNEVTVSADKIDIPNQFSYPAISSIGINKPSLNQGSEVILKAKQNRQVEVLACGSLNKIKLPSTGWLNKFNDSELKLSVSVYVNDSATHKILASTKRPISISLSDETKSQESPISFVAKDTHPYLWLLEEDFNEDSKPTIAFSNEITFKDDFKKHPVFLSSALPSVLKEVLSWIWKFDNWDDDGPWIPIWKGFVTNLGADWHTADTADPENDDDREVWVKNVVTLWLEHNYSPLVARSIDEFSDSGE